MIQLINFVIFFLFALAYALGFWLDTDWLKLVMGILLLFYLPGHNLNCILLHRREKTSWLFRLGFDVSSSLALFSILYLMLQNYIGYYKLDIVIFILIVNMVLAVVGYFIAQNRPTSSLTKKDNYLLVVLLIPIALFVLRVILNPYIFEIDSLHYFDAYRDIIKMGNDTSYLFAGREAFPFYFTATHYVAGLNYTGIFKFFTPVIFYLTSTVVLALLTDKKRPALKWLYLLILAAPMTAVMAEGVRPETFSLILTLPVLAACYIAITKNSIAFLGLSLLYSTTAFRFHESAFLLLTTAVVTGLVMLILNRQIIYRAIRNYPVTAIAIAIPYLILIATNYHSTLSVFQNNVMLQKFFNIFSDKISHPGWNWWFIDSITDALGAKTSWPGYSALWYYLYDGISVLIFLALIIFFLITKRKKIVWPRYFWWVIVPSGFFLVAHLSLAEFFPRLGIAIMFNRSWPYIALGATLFVALLARELLSTRLLNKWGRWLIAGALVCGISGAVGATAVSVRMGGMVLPQEQEAIKEIKNLPDNTLIVSPQRNHNLVKIYAKKNFVQIKNGLLYNNENFLDQIQKDIETAIVEEKRIAIARERVYEKNIGNLIFNNRTVMLEQEKIKVKDTAIKLSLLEKYNPVSYRLLKDKLDYLDSNPPTYYLYSFAKLDRGALSTRKWWRVSADEKNYEFFANYAGEAVTKNDTYILIKIR